MHAQAHMYTCLFVPLMFVCVRVCLCLHACMLLQGNLCECVLMYMCECALFVQLLVGVCVCVRACVCVCVCVCTYVCVVSGCLDV